MSRSDMALDGADVGAAGGASARVVVGSPTRLSLRWTQDRSGTPVIVNRSNRSETDATSVGMFHVLPQTKRTTGGAPNVASRAAFSASCQRRPVRSWTFSIGGSVGVIV